MPQLPATDIETKLDVADYVARLQARAAVLRKRENDRRVNFPSNVKLWQTAMIEWLQENAMALIEDLDARKLKESNGYRGTNGFNPDRFFRGAPMPPGWPEERTIRKIQGLLNHLEISGQKTVLVKTAAIQELFVDKEESDDE